MATATKPQNAFENTTAQAAQEITARLGDASKKAATEYLNLTEQAAKSVVGFQQQLAAQTDVDWVAQLLDAQATLTGEVSKVVVSTGRELLK
jgi:hypothetical protein